MLNILWLGLQPNGVRQDCYLCITAELKHTFKSLFCVCLNSFKSWTCAVLQSFPFKSIAISSVDPFANGCFTVKGLWNWKGTCPTLVSTMSLAAWPTAILTGVLCSWCILGISHSGWVCILLALGSLLTECSGAACAGCWGEPTLEDRLPCAPALMEKPPAYVMGTAAHQLP